MLPFKTIRIPFPVSNLQEPLTCSPQNLASTLILHFQPPALWETNVCYLSLSVYGILLQQPEQTNIGSYLAPAGAIYRYRGQFSGPPVLLDQLLQEEGRVEATGPGCPMILGTGWGDTGLHWSCPCQGADCPQELGFAEHWASCCSCGQWIGLLPGPDCGERARTLY